MSEPKAKLKGITDLGRAIDERIARRAAALHLRHGAGQAPDAPLSGGGSPGGGGGGEPALPETFVKTLRKQGESDALHGDIVLAADGDAKLAQSPTAPHFTFAAPQYTAADGVARVGDEFRSDSTVVRTSGDQSIGGVKSFTSFPVTPSAAPTADYEAANKKYVDDGLSSAPCGLWQRTGDVLSPKTLNDQVQVATDQPFAVHGQTSASGTSECGVKGEGTATTGVCYGVAGVVASSDNAAYGGKFTRTALGSWADLDEQSSAPATPPAGKARVFAKPGPFSGHRAYLKDDAGVVHDLAPQSKQVFWAASEANGTAGCAQRWTYGKMPGAFNLVTVTAKQNCTFNTPAISGDAGIMTDSYCAFTWTSTYAPVPPVPPGQCLQSYVIIGAVARRFPGDGGAAGCNTARVSARLKLNNASYFDKITLAIHDSAAVPHSATLSAYPGGSDWAEYLGADVDITGWTAPLRVTLAAYGALHTDASRSLEIDVEYLSLELWAE